MIISVENIFILRYILIPSAGFFFGGIIFFIVYKKYSAQSIARIEFYLSQNFNKIFALSLSGYAIFCFVAIILRYFNAHLGVFDFGIYDWRIWEIHAIPWAEWPEKFRSALTGHFQPILVVFSILYDLGFEPLFLNIFQEIAVLSAIVPLYLLAKDEFDNRLFPLLVLFFFLLFPATQFNILIDFHPDHLIIPFFLWCYYLAEKGKYFWTIPFFLAGCTLKEPLILAFAFLGIYIAWRKRHYFFGGAIFLVSLGIFWAAIFWFVPKVAKVEPAEQILASSAFGYLFNSNNLIAIIKEFLRFEKWRFPFFLLFPFLLLPLLKFKAFIPAIPLLLIPIASTVVHHQNVASQYTAGIIPPLFFSLTLALADLNRKYGTRLTVGILSWIGFLLIAFNVAHSPSPLAVAFWNKEWSLGKWHYSNYLPDSRRGDLEEAIRQIPVDPSVRVVVHSLIYDPRLMHRYFITPFPEKWELADYILLDNARGRFVSDNFDKVLYRKEVAKVQSDPNFELIFEKQGILLFRKIM